MEINTNIERKIFRGYDIRGVYPKDIVASTAYTIGLAFGSKIQDLGKKKCVVGHDNRLSSDELYAALIEGIKETGVDIISLGLCTTPMYYYACIKLGIPSGVMVTASHNPKDDNGFKFALDEKGNAKGQEIQDFYDYMMAHKFKKGEGKVTKYDIKKEYFDLFKRCLSFGKKRIKAVIDCGNGTTSIIAEELYNYFPIDVVPLFTESDGSFPNHHPDPCVEENLTALKKKVIETKADVGLAFDGDGDRIGVVSNTGKYIPTDHYLILMIRDIFDKVKNKTFLYDIKCSKAVEDVIDELGGKKECYRTGNSYTKARVHELNLPLGGELSGHVYFNDRFPGFDSGLYAGLRMVELLSRTDKTVDELVSDIPKYYSTEELKFKSPDEEKFNIVNKVYEYALSKNYKTLTIDGVKVLFDDGFALVRASNTGPNITARFEAKTEERLKIIEKEFIDLLNQLLNK